MKVSLIASVRGKHTGDWRTLVQFSDYERKSFSDYVLTSLMCVLVRVFLRKCLCMRVHSHKSHCMLRYLFSLC